MLTETASTKLTDSVETATSPDSESTSSEPIKIAQLTRVSTKEQNSGGGLETQKDIIEEQLEELDQEIKVVLEKEEKGISGTKFPRESLFEILIEAQERDLDLLCVKDISRLGRVAAPVANYIWALKRIHGIDVLTENGIYDINREDDLIMMIFHCLNAETKNRYRSNYVHSTQLNNFGNGKFHVANWNVRFGYQKTAEDGDPDDTDQIKEGEDLKIDHSEKEVVEAIFKYAECLGVRRDLFSQIYRRIEQEFPDSDIPNKDAIHGVLRDKLYIGIAEWEMDIQTENEPRRSVNKRSDLQIVDEDLFDTVQAVLDTRDSKYGYGTEDKEPEDTMSLKDFMHIAGWERVAAFDEVVRVHCPECGEEMYDNGHWRATSDLRPSGMDGVPENPILKRYRCKNEDCLREKRFPNEFEAYCLLNTDLSISDLVNM
jgi:hypothetical protein